MLDLATIASAYKFRRPRPGEDPARYRANLAEHVEHLDMAAGFEVRLDKRQADWSPEDVRAFAAHFDRHPRSTHETIHGSAFTVLRESPFTVDDATLLGIATKGVQSMKRMREQKPRRELMIMASVLLTTGELLTTPVGRDDRIAIIKALAKVAPVFGYLVVFDAFMHTIGETAATKTDCIMAQVGTRDLRILKRWPYVVRGKLAIFDAEPPADVDLKDEKSGRYVDDPYADIFVSVPPPTGAPS